MFQDPQRSVSLPTPDEVRRAILLYIEHAYAGAVSSPCDRFMPPETFDPAQWLMSEFIDRDPADAPLANVRSFALRLGNTQYPHMKLRLSRPPNDTVFVFSVDAHDAFLHLAAGSPDYQALEDLKKINATIAAAVMAAWDSAGLLTERNYLRRRIQQARDSQQNR